MLRRLLSIVVFAALAVVGSQASPLTVYFTGTCSDCIGFGANGTVNASITFIPSYFYNIIGPAESTNLAYGDFVNGSFTGVDAQTSSIASFIYDGSNKQAPITTTVPYGTFVVFGWNGQNPFPGPQSVTMQWGNPTGIAYEFSTVLNSLSSSGDWSFTVTDNRTGGRTTEDQGTNGSWSFTAPPPATVPEPATWGMMAGGLGLLGILSGAAKLRG